MKKLSSEEVARYERSLRVEGFDTDSQLRLNAAAVLAVGAGGLGSAALSYLAAAGIGRLGIADFDTVSASNLQRQILYATPQIGKGKAVCAAERLKAQKPSTVVKIKPSPQQNFERWKSLKSRLDEGKLLNDDELFFVENYPSTGEYKAQVFAAKCPKVLAGAI